MRTLLPEERLPGGCTSSGTHFDNQLITIRCHGIPRERATRRPAHNAALAVVLAAVTGAGEPRTSQIDGAPAMRADRRDGGKTTAIEHEQIHRIFPPLRHQTQRTTWLGEFRMLAERKSDAPVLERHAPGYQRRA